MLLGRNSGEMALDRLTILDRADIEEAEPRGARLDLWYSFAREQRFCARVTGPDQATRGPLAFVRGYYRPGDAARAAIRAAQARLAKDAAA